ncbi:hypothetical protein H0H92_006153 [Tricholoma furcatifolium]|nr:hypothetical protein H0H92_006153 [Tricholoma furcatifolium]
MAPLVDSDFDLSFVRRGTNYDEYFSEDGQLRVRANGAKNIEAILRVYNIDESELPFKALKIKADEMPPYAGPKSGACLSKLCTATCWLLMFQFCDECPSSLKEQETRLRAARALSQANVSCVVWGEDALAFVHWVPTYVFFLHLVVADHDVPHASRKVIEALPYQVFTGCHEHLVEPWIYDLSEPRLYPNAATLQCTKPIRDEFEPEIIVIHRESDWCFNVADRTLSVPLSPFPENIRFPTRTAFLDSIIECLLDPPSGQILRRAVSQLHIWLAYIVDYTLRTDSERLEVMRSLKPENQPYFDAHARRLNAKKDLMDNIVERRRILERLGKHEQARRPLPIMNPRPSK